jgi:hypothetical protein
MSTVPEKPKSVWVLRALALVVLVAAFIVAGSVDDEETDWYMKAAVTVVYVFSFVGAVNLFLNTLKSGVPHTPFLKQFMSILWLLIVAAVGIVVQIYAF